MRVLLNEAPLPLQEMHAPRAELVDVIRCCINRLKSKHSLIGISRKSMHHI